MSPNLLANEQSLYLRQHADNPVEWHPWGSEALELAARLDRPVLLSAGYSSCHWCHVMAHESFEDPDVAAVMNELFVNVKLDREERPDVDGLYMDAVQALTGHGGWPMTVFLTPDGRPFWGGTYFPRHSRHGMPGFVDVLRAIHTTWTDSRDEVERVADKLTSSITPPDLPVSVQAEEAGLPSPQVVQEWASTLLQGFDPVWGGFEVAPKFPPPMAIEMLLRMHLRDGDGRSLEAATRTLDAMLFGGIYDQLAGGFHRYSVDGKWMVPHFEKMLYDNAQLARAYLLAWQVTAAPHYRRAVEETLDYLLREMRVLGGAIAASQDADTSEGEGTYYSWTPEQMEKVLGAQDASFAAATWRVIGSPTFEGAWTLSLEDEPDGQTWERLRPLRARLLAARSERPAPSTDMKVVAAWNGLALSALARAAVAFERPDYLDAATQIAEHLSSRQTSDGTLHRSWHPAAADGEGTLGSAGFADDYACVGWGMMALYEATFEQRWFDEAVRLADRLLEHFDDRAAGGFFQAPEKTDDLVARRKDVTDHPTPSPNSMAATLLAELARWFPEREYRERAVAAVGLVSAGLPRAPIVFGQAAIATDALHSTGAEVAVVLPTASPPQDAWEWLAPLRRRWLPDVVRAAGPEGSAHPGLQGRTAGEAGTGYLCRNLACERPAGDPKEFAAQLETLAQVPGPRR